MTEKDGTITILPDDSGTLPPPLLPSRRTSAENEAVSLPPALPARRISSTENLFPARQNKIY